MNYSRAQHATVGLIERGRLGECETTPRYYPSNRRTNISPKLQSFLREMSKLLPRPAAIYLHLSPGFQGWWQYLPRTSPRNELIAISA
jgi:hypothetical protein